MSTCEHIVDIQVIFKFTIVCMMSTEESSAKIINVVRECYMMLRLNHNLLQENRNLLVQNNLLLMEANKSPK